MQFTKKDMRASGVEQRTWLQNGMLATLLTGVTIVSARFAVHIPFTPVPVTLQVFAVLLSGLLLGRRWGAAAQVQYLVLGAIGLPVFARGGFGFTTLFGLTGGYLLSYPIAAGAVGWIVGRAGSAQTTLARQFMACAVGLAIIYAMGCSWFAVVGHVPLLTVALQGALIFLLWDMVKAIAAIAVARGADLAMLRMHR